MAGFTLMEAIVAIVILSGVIVALEHGAAASWQSLREAEGSRQAVAIARRRLALASVPPLVQGEVEGQQGRFHWRIVVAGYDLATRAPLQVEGLWIESAVSWRERPFGPVKTVALRTLALQRSAP